MRVKNLK